MPGRQDRHHPAYLFRALAPERTGAIDGRNGFNAAGEFVALIGTAKLTGGCKNVAVAASPSGDRVYFCDLPGSRIIVLAQKSTTRAASAE